MILVGNQRGGARDMALHLLKDENDHVEVYEIDGFASDTLMDAFKEVHAISKATRCRQFLYSLSVNPPIGKEVKTEDFIKAINEAGETQVFEHVRQRQRLNLFKLRRTDVVERMQRDIMHERQTALRHSPEH